MLKLRKNKKGFTLVELIVVIAIMAVLAGVVAGVTVSQLNKQTNKTGSTQAKTIADFISTVALTGETNDESQAEILKDGAFDGTELEKLVKAQYGASSITVTYVASAPTTDPKGEIRVYLEGTTKVHVKYYPKGTNGQGAEYIVGADGVVSKPGQAETTVTPGSDEDEVGGKVTQ